NRILSLLHDDAGTLWVGTSSGGIGYWNPLRQRFAHVRPDPDRPGALRAGNVFAMAEAPDGALWVGTTAGLFRTTDGAAFRRFDRGDGLADEQIQALTFDSTGTLWVGTLGGLCRLPSGASRFACQSVPELSSDFILAVTIDRNGVMWLGTRLGLLHRAPGETDFRVYRHDTADSTSLSDDDVRAVLEDSRGRIWVGTMNGLNRFDQSTGRFERFMHAAADSTSLSNPTAWTLLEDGDGRLWVGTFDGISVLGRDGKFRRIGVTDGLPNGVIYGLVEDAAGRIWASSNRGLSRIETAADGTLHIRNYTPEDGLQSYEFNLNARTRLADGRIVFGGVNGYNVFDPATMTENRAVPPVVLTGLSVLGHPYEKPVASVETLRLPHDESFFTLTFAALDFVSPAQNHYRYRLEGLDEDWIDAGTRPVAVYTSVPPGRYTFRVRGSNGDGVWNEAGLALPVVITPPFWQTWWFRLMAVALMAAALAGAYRMRVRRLLAVERMRLRIAGDLHDDVGASLGSIILLSDMVRRSDSLAATDRRRLEAIGQTAREMSADLREIVWIVNPEHDHMDDLVERLRRASAGLLDGIPHIFEAPETLSRARLGMAFRRDVLRAYKEMLHNVRKHADASRVRVRVAHDDQRLTIRVEDDGRGFEEAGNRDGHGLKSLRERAARLGGSVTIDSTPGLGTTVVYAVPIHADA
ncbi:MAG TPA: two-component regulator propeller domain-containing protein, partial [Rhodothermales bacterium]